jgi:secreted trypsin-like serine protease
MVLAAHCFINATLQDLQTFKVRANRLDISIPADQDKGIDYSIQKIHCHEQFVEKTFKNDICLIRLQPQSNFASTPVSLVALDTTNAGDSFQAPPSNDDFSFTELKDKFHDIDTDNPLNGDSASIFVAGWGAESFDAKISEPIALRAEMKLASVDKCQNILGTSLPPSQIVCAVGADNRADACLGDSGGPLYLQKSNEITLVGLVSFGVGCGQRRRKFLVAKSALPAVYTRVYAYRTWIDTTMKNLNSATKISQRNQVMLNETQMASNSSTSSS